MSLELTKPQFTELNRQITRMYDTSIKLTTRAQRRRDYELKTLKSLSQKMNLITNGETKPTFNRNELRFVQKLMKSYINGLVVAVIPGYEVRMSKADTQEQKNQYQEYLQKAKNKVELCKGLLNAVERAL